MNIEVQLPILKSMYGYHGIRFDKTGRCVEVPSGCAIPPKMCVGITTNSFAAAARLVVSTDRISTIHRQLG